MKRLFKNIFGDLLTTATGSTIGGADILEGIQDLQNPDKTAGILKILKGAIIIILGALSTTKKPA
jgi:hypothetical protein